MVLGRGGGCRSRQRLLFDGPVAGVFGTLRAFFRSHTGALFIFANGRFSDDHGAMSIDVVGARKAGLRPVLMDPFELHLDADYARVGSLAELARLVDHSTH